VSWTRRWYRVGSSWLLIAAGAHLAAHYRAFVAVGDSTPLRRDAIDAMQAYVIHPALGTTLWTVLGGFSLAYAAMLALFGTTHWILARESEPRVLRRHALRTAVLCILATAALGLLHPVPQALVVFAVASVLFALAAWPRALDI
jgi:hypothetical protein